MSYRFTLAALTAALTLTGCAKHQKAGTPDDFFSGPSQINVSHVMTRADDGSSIFLTVDGNDAGPLLPGKNTEVQIPAGKHQVGGYAQTLLGLGRVTIPSVEVTTNPGEVTQLAYSVTRTKPVFVKEGVSKLPAKPAPAPEPAKEEAAPVQDNQSAAVATPATGSSTVSAATDNSGTAEATTQSTTAAEPAATTETTQINAAAEPAATTETTQTNAAAEPAATTETTQTNAAAEPAATTETTQTNAAAEPAAATETTQTDAAAEPAATTETTQNKATEQSATTPIATAQASGRSE